MAIKTISCVKNIKAELDINFTTIKYTNHPTGKIFCSPVLCFGQIYKSEIHQKSMSYSDFLILKGLSTYHIGLIGRRTGCLFTLGAM